MPLKHTIIFLSYNQLKLTKALAVKKPRQRKIIVKRLMAELSPMKKLFVNMNKRIGPDSNAVRSNRTAISHPKGKMITKA
jgi:hypothetical protein